MRIVGKQQRNEIHADFDTIAGIKDVLGDSRATNERAVGAVQVDQAILTFRSNNPSVAARYIAVVDDNVAIAASADCGFVLFQPVTPPVSFLNPTEVKLFSFPWARFHWD